MGNLVVGIAGISGAGKTTLVKELAQALGAQALYWDDFDDISEDPADYVEWFERSGSYDEWRYDSLADVLAKLKAGLACLCPASQKELLPTNYIIFDAPLGRLHKATGALIDVLVFLNTPMDICLARRTIRDYSLKADTSAQDIIEDLSWYLEKGRPLFDLSRLIPMSELVIDGAGTTADQVNAIRCFLGRATRNG